MTTRRYGDGNIEQRGSDTWRLRYQVGGQAVRVTFRGSRAEAQKRLRSLLKAADDQEHVAPSRLTLRTWAGEWIALLTRGEGGERRGLVSARTSERYQELLDTYVLPTLGAIPIQQLTTKSIDAVYLGMETRGLSPTTVRHVHVALRACLKAAQRKGQLGKNPTDNVDVPRPVERDDIGQALDAADLKRLIEGFAGSTYQLMVITAAMTGARLGELLAWRWSDLDAKAGTLRIERAIELTRRHGRRLKEPKSKRGRRTIVIDADLIARLLAHRDTHLRIAAGVPDGVTDVDLSMVRLPAEALIFPSPVAADGFDFTRLRNPRTITREIRERFRRLGFKTLRFHDLRATHGTTLLNDGQPVHAVAARLGHDPAVLLKAYARRTQQADQSMAVSLNALSARVLK